MLGTFVAGRYSATYQVPSDSARSIGIMEEGYRLHWRFKKDVLARTDAYGLTPIEAFHLGMEVGVRGTAKEWTAGTLTAVGGNKHHGWLGTGADNFNLGTIGIADTDNAGILILTATAGTPAAASPATLTITYATLHEDFDVDLLLGPMHRVIPWDFRVYPHDNAGTIRFFAST